MLLDAGANAEVQPEWLVQFAQMGSVYARHRFGMAEPRVGLLSIGEEAGKGDSLRKEVFGLLEVAGGIDFIGNVEGRDITTGDIDVVVTDGFTGNVVLKSLEGAVRMIVKALLEAMTSHLTETVELVGRDGKVTSKRQTEYGYDVIEAPLPCVVAVSDAINEPRYPSLKGIMGAKKKPFDTVSAGDLGLPADEVGEAGSRTVVLALADPPARGDSVKIEDEGDAADKILAYLSERKLV